MELDLEYAHTETNPNDCSLQDLLSNQRAFLNEMSGLTKREGLDNNEPRLPHCNIPIFSGEFSEFSSFKDLFEAMIHRNTKIKNVQKLQYLKGVLKGEPLNMIRSIAVTDANYVEAWDMIKQRYDKKKSVLNAFFKRFLDQPNISHSSSKALRQMRNTTDEIIRGVKALGPDAETRDIWLIYLLQNKLDFESRQAWFLDSVDQEFPTMQQFLNFLDKRSDALLDCNVPTKSSANAFKPKHSKIHLMHAASEKLSCPSCSQEHSLNACEHFLKLNVSERRGFVAEKKLCFNCLRQGHHAVVCRSRFKCKECKRRHHTILHPTEMAVNSNMAQTSNIYEPIQEEIQVANSNANPNETLVNSTISNHGIKFKALLPTAIIQLIDKFGGKQTCRALLDSGAQASFITEACVQRLCLPRIKSHVSIKGMTPGISTARGAVSIAVSSCHSNEEIKINALILKELPTKLPQTNLDFTMSDAFRDLNLADPEFNQPGKIDLLIGADRFFNIIKDGRRFNENGSVIAQNTIFGWIFSGDLNIEDATTRMLLNTTISNNVDEANIDKIFRRFWELEELIATNIITPEQQQCEDHFVTTHTRHENGRFIVKIPFKRANVEFGDSLNIATRRFYSLERKLNTDLSLKTKYVEYNISAENNKHFYLPHHAVLKQSSTTTKVRVVFDGSCKSSNGISLNEEMLVGPTIQPALWSILVRFRKYEIAIAADIEKMYRQVLIADEDCNYQRILWREDSSLPLQHFKLTTVTFGLAASSFLATRVLQQLSEHAKSTLPRASTAIGSEFYVDDFLSGAHTISDAEKLKFEVTTELNKAGFTLRKWLSNSVRLMNSSEIKQAVLKIDDESDSIKILGLQWNPEKDTFSFKVQQLEDDTPTKRIVISQSSRIFDPLGWLAPSIILVKILFQDLWMRKLDWDDLLPSDALDTWNTIKNEFHFFEKISIPRFIYQQGEVELHGFSDASEKAYSAVIYCRARDEKGYYHVNIVAAKTKVAPIRQVSIPRLELCGAHLMAKLLIMVRNTMECRVKMYAWTDSSIVLSWLSSHPSKWKTFVANRTSEILQLLPRQHWGHVRSNQNPADHASRGILPSKLVDLTQWWSGRSWLNLEQGLWPTNLDEANTTSEEQKPNKSQTIYCHHTQSSGNIFEFLVNNISSFSKMVNILGFIYRFINNSRKDKEERSFSPLHVDELQHATIQIIKYVQQQEFQDDILNLKKNSKVENKSQLLSLTPFLDKDQLLRVGGRLSNASCSYDVKYPIILPRSHPLSKLIIVYIHKKYLHPGPSLTSHLIRQKYWLIRGRATVRSEVKKCVTCFRNRASTTEQLMGSLPAVRVTPARPFTSSGVDYAGPITLASKRGRGAKMVKGYIAVFVCMVIKAVHIEIVSDLTTESFIAALKRFVARRGVPAEIYSDNGTNFVGAKRQLKEVYDFFCSNNNNDIVTEFLSQNGTRWHSIPPSAPHFGGLWEATVKSVKTHLIKATSNIYLTFEEMSTLLCQIEAILNSRPLSPISEDDTTMEALTPAHFLIGATQGSIPEEDVDNIPLYRLTRWQLIQQRTRSFWKRYTSEYINGLQQRYKWQYEKDNLKIDDLVLLKEDNLPSCKWALGRIQQIHPDDNGRVRVVTVRTSTSALKRPISKLCKLPIC